MKPFLRNSTYHLRKRVPRRFQSVEDRKEVWISLHTDIEAQARIKAPNAWAEMIEAWEARLGGSSEDAEKRFAAATRIANRRGFEYIPMQEQVKLPLPDMMARL